MPRLRATPDRQRRRRAAQLRARGLSLAEVGRRMGVSKQAAHQLLRLGERGRHNPFRVRCRACGADINPAGARPWDDRKVLCLPCLGRQPGASFGERLKAHRLVAGLKIQWLADRAGVAPNQVSGWEHGRYGRPQVRTVARLSRALGVGAEAFGQEPKKARRRKGK